MCHPQSMDYWKVQCHTIHLTSHTVTLLHSSIRRWTHWLSFRLSHSHEEASVIHHLQYGMHTHPFTHPFNGPFSGTTQVSRYQKGKTNLDFTEARDSQRQWHQLGHMQVCTSLQTDKITMPAPHHSVFYRSDALPAAQPTASKHWRHLALIRVNYFDKSR